MIAIINGIRVEGTPQEIEEYRQLTGNAAPKKKVETLCDCLDWRDLQASPFCHKCGGTGSY